MDLSKIISISGKPGLYRLIAQAKGGFIVEDLDNGKKTSIGSNYNVSLLDNVAIYGVSEEFPLVDVFSKIYAKENGEACISHKESKEELRAYMKEVLPEYDEIRVYDSDIKKLFQWYNILLTQGLLVPNEEEKVEEEEADKTEKVPKKEAVKKELKPKAEPKKVFAKNDVKKTATKKGNTTAPKASKRESK